MVGRTRFGQLINTDGMPIVVEEPEIKIIPPRYDKKVIFIFLGSSEKIPFVVNYLALKDSFLRVHNGDQNKILAAIDQYKNVIVHDRMINYEAISQVYSKIPESYKIISIGMKNTLRNCLMSIEKAYPTVGSLLFSDEFSQEKIASYLSDFVD